MPLAFVGAIRRDLVAWTRRFVLRPGFELVSPADMQIPQWADTADDAIASDRARHATWTPIT